jgi:cyclic beta-1,2-glucan synthetase
MWIAPAVALATGLLLATAAGSTALALPMLGVWLAAPWIAWWISQPIESPAPDCRPSNGPSCDAPRARPGISSRPLSPRGRTGCRRTTSGSAHADDRLADLAHEHGAGAARQPGGPGFWVSFGGRPDPAHAGHPGHDATARAASRHFYNWYDTRTLRPLLPLYVSSVDSGNLAGIC